jgi:hypothetical protein
MSSKEDIYPTAFNRKMSTPEQEIEALKAEIAELWNARMPQEMIGGTCFSTPSPPRRTD